MQPKGSTGLHHNIRAALHSAGRGTGDIAHRCLQAQERVHFRQISRETHLVRGTKRDL